MMRYKKTLIIICSLALLVILALFNHITFDKQVSDTVKYDIAKGSNDSYYAYGSRGVNKIYCEVLSSKHVRYYLEDGKYSEDQINDFINKVETLRAFFQNELDISFKDPLSVYISKANMLGNKEGKIYLNSLDLESVDVINTFLQAIFEDTVNYGLCYGLAYQINEKLYNIFDKPSVSIEELGQYYSQIENIPIMDLTIPVFQDIYFNGEQNKYAYATSYYFVKDLVERKGFNYSAELLENSSKLDIDFDIQYANEKNIWLESIGATQKCVANTIPIRYSLETNSTSNIYPYIIYTPSTISRFVSKGEFINDSIIIDYAYINYYLHIYEQDISALKKYLSPYFDTDKDIIECYFNPDFKLSYYRHEDSESSSVIEYLEPNWNGVHEYAHYITWRSGLPLWMQEGIAEYSSNYLFDEDIYRMKYEFYIPSAESIAEYIQYSNLHIDNEEREELKRKIEEGAYLSSKNKEPIEETIAGVNNISRIDEDGGDFSYSDVGSFVNYLIKVYGEDKFFNLYKDYSNAKLESTYGKTFNELKEDWFEYINNSLEVNYVLGPNEYKILFTDTSDAYLPSAHTFVNILSGKTYEYVDCGLGRYEGDDEKNPNINDFEGIDVRGKIALIQRGNGNFYKKTNNAAEAGAIGVIIYNNVDSGYVNMGLEGVKYDVPAIFITMEDGELLKNAEDKKITVDEDFIGIIDNNSSKN